jgi:hypothetical protein
MGLKNTISTPGKEIPKPFMSPNRSEDGIISMHKVLKN